MSNQNLARGCLTHDLESERPVVVGKILPPPGRLIRLAAVAGLLGLSGWTVSLRAEPIPVPNASFESPVTGFVDTRIDSWQKTPKPFWYDESGGFLWDQLTGLFKNTTPGSVDHIDNCDGNQAIFLFALPEAGLFQDYDSTDWTNATPTHAFDARFEVGKSYELTVGVIGGTGGMTNGVTMRISLYYRDAASNQVTVAATTVTHTPTVFTNSTHLVDFQVRVPTVRSDDAWAGRNIGVQLLSTVDPALAGGYWDLDNVRLTSLREPVLRGMALAGGQFGFTLESEPGTRFEILASTNILSPLGSWTSLGTVTNVSGSVPFTDPETTSAQRFYRARALP